MTGHQIQKFCIQTPFSKGPKSISLLACLFISMTRVLNFFKVMQQNYQLKKQIGLVCELGPMQPPVQAFSLSAQFAGESAMLKLPEDRKKWGESKGAGWGRGERRENGVFFSPLPLPLSFFRPRTYRKGYYFYSPQSSTVIKSKMATTTTLRTRTRFHPPKIRLHCRRSEPLRSDIQAHDKVLQRAFDCM